VNERERASRYTKVSRLSFNTRSQKVRKPVATGRRLQRLDHREEAESKAKQAPKKLKRETSEGISLVQKKME